MMNSDNILCIGKSFFAITSDYIEYDKTSKCKKIILLETQTADGNKHNVYILIQEGNNMSDEEIIDEVKFAYGGNLISCRRI